MPSPWYGGGTRHGLFREVSSFGAGHVAARRIEALVEMARSLGGLVNFGDVATEVGGEMVGGLGL